MENVSRQYYKVCFCFNIMFKLRKAEPPADIQQVFLVYSENDTTMSIEGFHRFLTEYQGDDDVTRDHAQSIFNSLKHHLKIFHRNGLHFEAFFRYLFGDHNLALSPSLGVHHNMKAPLAHYFLYTGHNSYLTGNQVSSNCSVDPIIKALKNAVRVIELDLWPNSRGNDVDVCHGGTLTSPVKLIKCLQAIKDYAFVASEYPVVITFEDHLTPELQDKVARMVYEIFGDMLFFPESMFKELPSPESLKKKIMISTKPPAEYSESETVKQEKSNHGDEQHDKAVDNEVPGCRQIDIQDEDPKCTSLIGFYAMKIKNIIENWFRGEKLQELEQRLLSQNDNLRNVVVPQYRQLIAIEAMKKKGSTENCLRVDSSKAMRLSLSEQELEAATLTHGTDIVRFTQHNLLRVYPKGTRFDSSNFNPFVGWTHGAQMVAFNMQGYGKHLWEMQGMFRANGSCGYVKKPDILLNPHHIFVPNDDTLPIKTTLKVKVYMGQGWHSEFHHTHFDAYSPPDFYTKIEIAGVCGDKKKEKTETIMDEWEPVWNKEFEFPLRVPELALLRVKVIEYDTTKTNDFGGQTCLPISELRTGIRCVRLYDRKGEIYKSVKLLMRFTFVDGFYVENHACSGVPIK